MSDAVLITLIIAVTVLAVLVLFRSQLSRFFFKAGTRGVEASVETHNPDQATTKHPDKGFSRNSQKGWRNKMRMKGSNTPMHDNEQLGTDNEMKVTGKTPKS